MKAGKATRPRSGARAMGGSMSFLVSVDTPIAGNITLPPNRYSGTVAWKETTTCKSIERSKKRYKIELPTGDVVRRGDVPDRHQRRGGVRGHSNALNQ